MDKEINGEKDSWKKKHKKHYKKLLEELDQATSELDKDMMESFKKVHVDTTDFEKSQKQTGRIKKGPWKTLLCQWEM